MGTQNFSLSHTRDKTKNIFFYINSVFHLKGLEIFGACETLTQLYWVSATGKFWLQFFDFILSIIFNTFSHPCFFLV